jgi:type VI protein secretion system component VasK
MKDLFSNLIAISVPVLGLGCLAVYLVMRRRQSREETEMRSDAQRQRINEKKEKIHEEVSRMSDDDLARTSRKVPRPSSDN